MFSPTTNVFIVSSENFTDVGDAFAAYISEVGRTGDYADLLNKPTLGSASEVDINDDDTLAGNAADEVPSVRAVKKYIDDAIAALNP